ncbi:hypothetical protein V8E54_008894 [Elaphomyces granulatus]
MEEIYATRKKRIISGSQRITGPDDFRLASGTMNWTYPHEKLPHSWVGSWTTTTAPEFSAEATDSTTSPHDFERWDVLRFVERLVPVNDMQLYNSNHTLSYKYWLDDKVNSISLRVDIHRKFDAGCFVIVRKDGTWVNHFLKPTNELGIIFHNREVSLDSSLSPHFLLVRFALAIFPLVAGMFGTSDKRLVRVKAEEGKIGERDIELEGRSILENSEKKKTGSKKRKDDDSGARAASEDASAGVSESSSSWSSFFLFLVPVFFFSEFSRPSSSMSHSSSWSPSLTRDSEGTIFKPEITPIRTITRPGRISAFDRYVTGLRRRALLAQRPHKPELICCDYEACDKASDLGLPYTICDDSGECLGKEFRVMPEVDL